jgi:hypothetical protein
VAAAVAADAVVAAADAVVAADAAPVELSTVPPNDACSSAESDQAKAVLLVLVVHAQGLLA